MRILITGAAGQLGLEFRRLFESGQAEIGPIPKEYRNAEVVYADSARLNIVDALAVDSFIKEGAFDLIINCAAVTNVDGCEADPDTAFSVNAFGAENVARAASHCATPVIYVSTDYVFSGSNAAERIETDAAAPLSVYGASKAKGERLVAAANPQHYIIRSAWLYGYMSNNFVKTMLRLARDHNEVTVVDDQLGNPTSANDLAYEILKIALTNDYGIWHVTNEGACSWADFAEAVLADTNCVVRRCTSQEYRMAHPDSADRPAFSSLRNKHLEDTIGNEMRPWQDALADYLKNLSQMQE